MGGVEHWLTRDRLKLYPRVVLVFYLILCVVWVGLSHQMVDPHGKPLGYDFVTFWSASHLALAGHPQDAYDMTRIFAAEQAAVPALQKVFLWFYPPSFYLLVLPFAFLPYLVSYFVFILSTLALYVSAFRHVVKTREAMWLLAAFPGVLINFVHGQNAFLTAALAAAALLCIERRAVLAGVFIGLLAIKPHLAILFPVVLLAVGAWRTFAVAGVVAAAVVLAGTVVLGADTLAAFVGSLSSARAALEEGVLPWSKMPTVFACLRMLGVPVSVAYVLHGAVALAAVAAVWVVWRRSGERELRGAAVMTGTFLVSPYMYDYDLAWLAFPIAWLALYAMRNGWRRGDREVLIAAWALPIVIAPFAVGLSVQVGPLVMIALLWSVVRRVDVHAATWGRGLPRSES